MSTAITASPMATPMMAHTQPARPAVAVGPGQLLLLAWPQKTADRQKMVADTMSQFKATDS